MHSDICCIFEYLCIKINIFWVIQGNSNQNNKQYLYLQCKQDTGKTILQDSFTSRYYKTIQKTSIQKSNTNKYQYTGNMYLRLSRNSAVDAWQKCFLITGSNGTIAICKELKTVSLGAASLMRNTLLTL